MTGRQDRYWMLDTSYWITPADSKVFLSIEEWQPDIYKLYEI